MASDEYLNRFNATLDDLETAVAARKTFRDGSQVRLGLERIIERSSSLLEEQYCEDFDDQWIPYTYRQRLYSLHSTVGDLSGAKRVFRRILIDELEASYKENGQGHDIGGNDQAQQKLLKVWRVFESEAVNDKSVEDALIMAIFAPFRAMGEASEFDGSHRKPDLLAYGTADVHSDLTQEADPLIWSIAVERIMWVRERQSLQGIDIMMAHDHGVRGTLVYLNSRTTEGTTSRMEILIHQLPELSYSRSTKTIKLHHYSSVANVTNVDVQMHTIDDADRLISKLKTLNESLKVLLWG
ncbi:MAG: hypothetical protein Q9225_003017 [Loekoesia sp. 1 TL-2023]